MSSTLLDFGDKLITKFGELFSLFLLEKGKLEKYKR